MSPGQDQSGGLEQRRYARVPINLDGYIAIGDSPPVPCTVRDFCYGGMFVSADAATYASTIAQMPAVLYFALIVGGVKQDYQIALSIARVVAKGIGVSFSSPDQAMLDLLAKLAAPGGMPADPPAGAAADHRSREFAADYARVVGPLQELVAEHVANIAKRFTERVDDALFVAARDAGNNVDQNRYLDGQRELRGRQKPVREEFPRKIRQGIEILGNPLESAPKDPSSIGLSDLSLIEKDDFEEFLAISEMVSELEPEFAEELFALGRRLSYLANRELPTSANPIGPGVLCNAVAESIKGLQSHRKVTSIVYRVLHEVMSHELGRFYTAVNDRLVELEILPVIEKDKLQVKRAPGEDKSFSAPVADALDDSQAQFAAPIEDDFADLMPAPEFYRGHASSPPTVGQARSPGYAGDAAPPPRHAPGLTPPAAPPGQFGVQAAPRTPPGRFAVQAAPPSMPEFSGVQAAVPSAPGQGAVLAAQPTLPGSTGTAAGTPTFDGHGGVQAAQPTLPGAADANYIAGGPAQAGWPDILAATGGGPATFGAGWTNTPLGYAPPTLQRAYSTAQAQLSLRRQINPVAAAGPAASEGGAYSVTQIAAGLTELQREFASGAGEPLAVDALKERIVQSLIGAGAPRLGIEAEAADAIEVVAGLFGALLEDALVARKAKAHLTRLQPAVHRAALLDAGFFERADHPVRQVVDRIARLRDGKSETQQQRHARVSELVGEANRDFRDDVGLFEDVLGELDEILHEQESEFHAKVDDVVHSCEEQQRILEARRGQSFETTDANERSDLPEEWNKWLERSRKLAVGERMLLNATSANPVVVTLVWKEARGNLFVFADEQGSKASTLTQQQVAMYLRRGILRGLDDEAGSALDRAMFGVVDRFHREVEAQATRDPLTGFLQRRFFTEEVDAVLADADAAATRHVAVSQIDIINLREVNDAYGDAVGDALLAAFADELTKVIRGTGIVFGRLGGASLGVYWPAGGVQGAYKRLQGAVPRLRSVAVPSEPGTATRALLEATVELGAAAGDATIASQLAVQFAIGMSSSEDGLIQAEGLLQAAREACETAREMGPGSIYVAGTENAERRQLEQLVAYAEQALEKNCLVLSGQHVNSLADGEILPSLHLAVSAVDRSGKPIPAPVFAPALARASVAHAVDMWAFRETLAWMQANEEALEQYALVIVPLSGASVRNEDLPNLIMTEFMETPVPPGRICFGLSDHDVVDNVVGVGDLISTLKEFGCRFVLDEFGSGHSNYDYIKTIEIDFVAIRSGFVADASKNPKDFAMAKSINELVHFMGKKTIAKQMPGAELGETMREIGIDFVHDQSDRVQVVSRSATN